MKAIKIIGMSLMTFAISGSVTAQREGSSTSTEIAVQKYFTDVKTLMTYFKNHEIPASFPKYDKVLGDEGNAKAAMLWTEVPANYALLSTAGIKKLEEFKAEKKAAPKK